MIVIFFVIFWLLGIYAGGEIMLYGLTVCDHETFMRITKRIMAERIHRYKTGEWMEDGDKH